MKNATLNVEIEKYIYEPYNPVYNFMLARSYEEIGHTASAITFFLRTAEFANDDFLSYEALLRIAICLDKQGNRQYSSQGVLLRAISLMPERPEAYNFLVYSYEVNRDWMECYAFSVLGENLKEKTIEFRTNVLYPGKYIFTLERAIAAYNIGLFSEAKQLFKKLTHCQNMWPEHKMLVNNNLKSIELQDKYSIVYRKEFYEHLRFKFQGAEAIKNNYSQAYQDMFVLAMLDGKPYGKFIEIGCDDPKRLSNTYLLETLYGWNGISIDIDPKKIEIFSKERKAKAITADATILDYSDILTENVYDYLQIDCEPAWNTYKALKRIPFYKVKFAVITFEHDHYIYEDDEIKFGARKYLESFGYKLIVNNIAEDRWSEFEDWYIHPGLVDENIVKVMTCISDSVKKADDYMLSRI